VTVPAHSPDTAALDERELLTAQAWMRDLLSDLTVLGEKYQEAVASPDGESRLGETSQLLLAATIGRVLTAFNEVPIARDNPGLSALHSLQAALGDLHRGNSPSILLPREGVGIGRDGIARSFVKNYALLFVELLRRAGYRPVTAREFGANLLTESGHRGRQGGRISKKTLWDWETNADAGTKAFLDRNLAHIMSRARSLTAADAEDLVRSMIASPMMKAKI
jgi:hypothetical protein